MPRKSGKARTADGVVATRRAGRPPGSGTLLTQEREDALITSIEHGVHIVTACALAQVPTGTLYGWLRKGHAAQDALDDGKQVEPEYVRYADFATRLAGARASAENRAVGVINSAMLGGAIVSEEPIVDLNGVIQCDPASGKPLYKRTYSTPDGRLALEYLARTSASKYGRGALDAAHVPDAQVSATGQETQLAQPLVVRALSERLDETRRMAARDAAAEVAEAEGTLDDPIDAEIVDDEE